MFGNLTKFRKLGSLTIASPCSATFATKTREKTGLFTPKCRDSVRRLRRERHAKTLHRRCWYCAMPQQAATPPQFRVAMDISPRPRHHQDITVRANGGTISLNRDRSSQEYNLRS